MIPMRASRRVVRMDGDSIVIATTAGRRLLYFGCFLVFLASFILNVDFRSDFSPPRAGGTVFMCVLMILCLGVAGWSDQVVVRKASKTVLKRVVFGGIPILTRRVDFSSSQWELRILDLSLAVSGGNRRGNTAMLRRFHDIRTGFHSLVLSGEAGKVAVADSSDIHEILPLAAALEGFLGIRAVREQI
jgi:hypothetical protein